MSCFEPQFSLTLFHHPSLSSIASGRSSRLHPMSVQRCCRYVLTGRHTIARPCEGVHSRTSLMSSSLHLLQCPACIIHLICMVFEVGGRWPYRCCFVGCSVQDLINITRSIFVQFSSIFFSIRLVSVQVVHPYHSMDTTTFCLFE